MLTPLFTPILKEGSPSRAPSIALGIDKHICLLLSRPSGTIGIDSQEPQCSLANWISQY